ncbi:unnamed protein product [Amoebophrya sp. A120]|nr:unnamed protein product [Amoebophrya sp. A120]|eukprot:GSA120T00020327001.1
MCTCTKIPRQLSVSMALRFSYVALLQLFQLQRVAPLWSVKGLVEIAARELDPRTKENEQQQDSEDGVKTNRSSARLAAASSYNRAAKVTELWFHDRTQHTFDASSPKEEEPAAAVGVMPSVFYYEDYEKRRELIEAEQPQLQRRGGPRNDISERPRVPNSCLEVEQSENLNKCDRCGSIAALTAVLERLQKLDCAVPVGADEYEDVDQASLGPSKERTSPETHTECDSHNKYWSKPCRGVNSTVATPALAADIMKPVARYVATNALKITQWKSLQVGPEAFVKWSLRVYPSSGALYGTEIYFLFYQTATAQEIRFRSQQAHATPPDFARSRILANSGADQPGGTRSAETHGLSSRILTDVSSLSNFLIESPAISR